MKQARRLDAFPEYVFSRLNRVVADVEKTSGRKVKNFGMGSPDVPPSEKYLSKLSELLREPKAHLYPGYTGIPEFNNAVSAWYKKRFNVDLNANEILPLLGAKDGLGHLPLAFADEGDAALLPDPGYPGFSGPALMAGLEVIPYSVLPENHFRIDVKEIAGKITDRTKYIIVNFPSNPTGAVTDIADLEPIVQLAKERDLALVYDNAYSEITFDGFVAPSIFQIPAAKEVAIELGSFSKTFSFAGYRMGWAVGNAELIAALSKVKSQMDSGMSLALQKLGAFALTEPDMEWHAKMISTYKERRDIIAGKLKKLGLTFEIPKGSLYLWAKIPDSAKNSETFCMDLLKEKQVLLTPGTAFGQNGERYLRASICVDVRDLDDYL